MKKRILSMLMLVVMVVTALPLMALTVFAVNEYEADDYNALYVQDGLVFAADFFESNSIWNPNGDAVSTTLADYVWSNTTAAFSLTSVATGAISGGALLMNKVTDTYLSITNSSALTEKGKNGTTAEYVGTFTTSGANAFAVNDLRANVNVETVDGKRGLKFKALGLNEASMMKVRTTDSKAVTFHAPVASGVITTLTMTMQVNYTNSYWGTYPMLRFSGVKATADQLSAAGVTNSTSWQTNFYATHTGDENGVTPREKVSVLSWIYNVPKYVTTDKIWDPTANDGAGGFVTDPEGEKTYIVGSIRRDGGDGEVAADFVTTNKLGSDGEYDTKKSSYTEAGHLGVYTNGVAAFDDVAYFVNNGQANAGGGNTYLKRQTMTAGTNYYAFRQYSHVLSAEEMAQNHMADLAKWFKIDITDARKLTKASLIALATDPAVAALTFESDAADVEKAIKDKAAALLAYQPETAPTFDIDDYNGLYVQDGLLYAFDFFDTNATWGGAAETFTSDAELVAAINARTWYNKTADYAKPIKPTVAGATSVTLENGKLDTTKFTSLHIDNLERYNNSSFGAGSSMELVADLSKGSQYLFLNNIRVQFETHYEKNDANPTGIYQLWIRAVGPQSNTLPGISFGRTQYVNAYRRLATLSMVTQVPKTTLDAPWWNHSASATCAYPPVKYRTGTYITLESGETVLSVSSTESASTPQFYLPAGLKTVTTDYVDGVKQDTAQTYENVYIKSEHYVTGGLFALYEDGNPFYVNENASYLNNTSAYYQNNYLKLGNDARPILSAARYYDRALTAAEAARNSFADLAKWYGIDGTYLLSLNDESLTKLATDPAVLALDFSSTKEAVEAVVLSKAEALFWEQFAGKIDIDIQALIINFGLDGSILFDYPAGLLSNTYTFLLGGFAGAQDVKAGYAAAYKADMDALSGIGDWTPEQYDALYVKEGLQFAADFFKMNSYWNVLGSDSYIDYTELVPVGPAENNAYWYDANENGVKDEGEIYDFTVDTSNHNTAAFTEARSKWITADKNFLLDFRTYTTDVTSLYLASSAPSYNADGRTLKAFSVFTVGNGYIQLRSDMWGSGFLNLNGTGSLPLSSANTLQLTAAMGGNLGSQPALIFHGVRPTGTNGDGFVYSGFAGGFTNFTYSTKKGFTNSATIPVSLTYTILGGDEVGDDAVKVLDQKTTYAAATGKLASTTKADASIYLGWNGSAKNMRIYAMRYYLADLTLEQREQNHFADLAKYFRLNLVGFDMMPEARKQALYKAVAGFDFTSARASVQAIVSEYILPYLGEGYEALKGTDETKNAFIDLGAEYLLNFGDLFTATRDMSSVYVAVNATSLSGKSAAKAQELLDEAIFDAYYYLSYTVADTADRAAEWNAMMASCATKCKKSAYVDLEALMALPYAKRLGALDAPAGTWETLEGAQDFIDAYVAEKMAEYTLLGTTLDYNDIYVQDQLIFAADFFETNKYWGEDVVKDMNHYVWTDTSAAYFEFSYKEGAIANGALLMSKWTQYESVLNVKNIEKLTNYAYDGASAQYIGAFTTSGLSVFAPNNLRTRVTLGSGKMTFNSLGFYSSNEQMLRDENGTVITFSAPYVSGAAATVTLMMTVPEHTVDYYGYNATALAEDQTYSWSKSPHLFQVTHEYDEENDGVVALTSKLDRSYLAYVPVIKTPAKIWDPAANEGAGDWVENTEGKKYIVDAIQRNPADTTWEEFLDNKNGGLLGTTSYYNTTAGHLGVYLNGTMAYDDDAYYPDNGNQNVGKGTTTLKPNMTVANDTKLYAFRQYAKELSSDEMKQNNFADLAKWFKLDVSAWAFMPESLRKQAYNTIAEAGYTFDSDPADIQEDIDEIFAAYYDDFTIFSGEGAAEKNEAFRELASAAWMNLDVLRNLNAGRREALIGGLVDSFDLAYSFSRDVFVGEYNLLVEPLTAMSFAGYQVRLDTGAPSQNYAGVRAVFDVNTALVEQLLVATGKTVTISAGIESEGVRLATISFTYSLDGDEVVVVGENRVFGAGEGGEDLVVPAYLYERGEGMSFNYVVTYKGEDVTAADYAQEYTYVYDILVDGVNNDFSVKTKTLGNEISAYEIYSLFAAMDAYKDDVVVKAVVPTIEE